MMGITISSGHHFTRFSSCWRRRWWDMLRLIKTTWHYTLRQNLRCHQSHVVFCQIRTSRINSSLRVPQTGISNTSGEPDDICGLCELQLRTSPSSTHLLHLCQVPFHSPDLLRRYLSPGLRLVAADLRMQRRGSEILRGDKNFERRQQARACIQRQ